MPIKSPLVFLAAALLTISTAHAGEQKLTGKQIMKRVKAETAKELAKHTTSAAMWRAGRAELAKLRKHRLISAKQLSALETVATSKNRRQARANLKAARALTSKKPSVYNIMVKSLADRLAERAGDNSGEPLASVSDDFCTIMTGAAFGAGIGAALGGPGGALVGAVAGAYAGAVAVGTDTDNASRDNGGDDADSGDGEGDDSGGGEESSE